MSVSAVVGVDSSTQSCKVEFRELDGGRLLARASAAHPPTEPPVSEQDPESWWQAFVRAFRRARAEAGAVRVEAISIAGQCHGFVPLDAAGRVIRPAKLWNDTTAAPELSALVDEIGARRFVETTGSIPTAAFTIAKVAWLRAHEPQHFARLRTILLPHDYLGYRLTGRYATDRSDASGTGYFDPSRNAYRPEHLARIDDRADWESMLPEVLPPDSSAGTVRAAAAEALGIGTDTVVGAGGGDQHASALGLGIEAGELVFSFGTSGVVVTTTPEPVRDLSGAVSGTADLTGGFLPLVCTLNAAKVTDTFARLLGVDHTDLSRLALDADDDGPVLAAFLDGERTPDRPHASGLLADLTPSATREQLARAAVEGVVFGLVGGATAISRLGCDTDGAVFAIGGGARSEATVRLLAEALGRPVELARTAEPVARGAAVQAAAVRLGAEVARIGEAWRPAVDRSVSPRPGRAAARRYARYREVAAVTDLDAAAPRESRDDATLLPR
ncbi:xylulokinase [Leucobacter weissii]|uniref:Xylulose kinase n=1 Tax=Leucobacter weissii TaxID=1983706 RepID=A0A939SB27_9MICO|nr:xylulokinase [Leucobacter weissii]MBO1901060.1 xylulokinase [Leucobacter weissii]